MPPLKSTRKILAVNDLNNTPLIPAYNMFGINKCSPGQLHYYSNKKWLPCKKTKKASFGKTQTKSKKIAFTDKHVRAMAKRLKVKMSVGRKRKTTKRLFGDVMRKGKTFVRSKTMTPEKRYVMKHCSSMAKKLKIKKRGRTHTAVWNEIMKKGVAHKEKKKVYKKRRLKTVQNGKVRKGRKRYTRRKKSKLSFGWWDNTQQLYGGTGATHQSAEASTLNGPFPFYNRDNWQPYYSIDGPSFGMKRQRMHRPHRPHMRSLNPMMKGTKRHMVKHNQMAAKMRTHPRTFPRPPMRYRKPMMTQRLIRRYDNQPLNQRAKMLRMRSMARMRSPMVNRFGMPPAIIEYNNQPMYPQYNSLDPVFDYNSLNLNVPRPQPAWPSYSNIGTYPSAIDSPYPFKIQHKRWY